MLVLDTDNLKEINNPNEHILKCFPSYEYGTIMEILIGTTVGYLLLQDSGPDVVGLHVHVLPEYRTTKVLRAIVKKFKSSIKECLKFSGKTRIISIANSKDTHIISLFKALKFNVTIVAYAEINMEDELWERE